LEDFFARQFVDTTYITTQVHEYVRCLGADLVCTKGQHTAELRHHWGLDTVLRELSDSPAWQEEADLRAGEKDRSDHRHHAIDAIVIALTNQSRLGQLAAIRPQGGTARTGEVLPEPWPNFRAAVVQAVKAINVSHRVRRKVSGALHEDTIYGPTAKKEPGTPIAQRPWAKRWVEQPDQFVYRKPLTALTLNEVSRIRDHALRALVEKRLAQFGLKPGRKRRPKKGSVPETEAETGRNKQIPKEVWKEPLQIGSGPPVKKVRLLKQDTSICSIRGKTALVKPGSNHHLALFEFTDHQGKTVREGLFITMLEAARRVKSGEPLIQRKHPTRPEARFLFSLSRGEAVLATINGKERLLIVRKLVAGKDIQRVVFVAHTDARPSKEMKEFAVMVKGLNVRKVTVDPLGRIRWAND
jgi:CRISPR-associated endonuclease Csn1